MPDGAGLRIAPNEDRSSLSIAVASLPRRGDTGFKAAGGGRSPMNHHGVRPGGHQEVATHETSPA